MAKGSSTSPPEHSNRIARMMFQGWVSLALWMSIGLLLEGLLGYKIPSYLNDLERRELFRLAHTHGAFLGLVLIAAALCGRRTAGLPRAASLSLSIGSALMPLGFLLAGIWHPEGDPGPAIWIVPPSALLIIFGAITLALACFNRNSSSD
jgi:hypothetical protein